MRAFAVFAAFIAAVVSGVLAGPGVSPAAIVARQSTDVPTTPTQCQSSCAALKTLTSCGSDLKCMCTNAIGEGIVSCGECGISYMSGDPSLSTYKNQFQSAVNAYANACTEAGYKIGPFIIDGGSSSGSGGSSGSGTSAGSRSSTTATSSGSSATGFPGLKNAAAPARLITGARALAGMAVVMAAIL